MEGDRDMEKTYPLISIMLKLYCVNNYIFRYGFGYLCANTLYYWRSFEEILLKLHFESRHDFDGKQRWFTAY